MSDNYLDFLKENSSEEKKTETPHEETDMANITVRADVDCQVDFDVPGENYVLPINDMKQQIDNAMGKNKEDDIVEDVKPNVKTFTVKGVSFDMIEVKGGTFAMGGTPEQGSDADDDEYPVHNVTLSDYYIGKFEVTQELWQTVMGGNPSSFEGDRRPVESVDWDYCQDFIEELNELTGVNFRLPTEAEWEYAARGGNKSKGYKYSGSDNIDDVAWYDGNSNNQTHEVGTKSPNELGIYDMSGNVGEWCQDYKKDEYESGSQTNPQGPSSGSHRVLRGGSWDSDAWYCRVSNRPFADPDYWFNIVGFRLVL